MKRKLCLYTLIPMGVMLISSGVLIFTCDPND